MSHLFLLEYEVNDARSSYSGNKCFKTAIQNSRVLQGNCNCFIFLYVHSAGLRFRPIKSKIAKVQNVFDLLSF